jgi:hypothetical protein
MIMSMKMVSSFFSVLSVTFSNPNSNRSPASLSLNE